MVAVVYGGAVYSNAPLTITGSSFADCSTASYGGAVAHLYFSDNTCRLPPDGGPSLVIRNSTFARLSSGQSSTGGVVGVG